MHRYVRRAVPLAALVAALAGCAAPSGEAVSVGVAQRPVAPPTAPVYVQATCPDAATLGGLVWQAPPDAPATPGSARPPAPGTVPAGFVAAGALWCETGPREYPGEGRWQVLAERRTADRAALDALLVQLRKPWRRDTGTCNLMLVATPYVVLTGTDGRTVWPAVPRTGCGQPDPGVLKAIRSLPWQTVSERRVVQLDTAGGLASGCPSGYKDIIAITDAGPGAWRSDPSAAVSASLPAPVRVCVYQVRPGDTQVGDFRSGGTLGTADVARVAAALSGAPVAPACTTRHTRFAVLSAGPAKVDSYLELDGCHRWMPQAGPFRVPDPSIAAILERVHA